MTKGTEHNDLPSLSIRRPVLVLVTTRRLIILPAYQTVRPSPHDLAGPLSVSLAGVGCTPGAPRRRR